MLCEVSVSCNSRLRPFGVLPDVARRDMLGAPDCIHPTRYPGSHMRRRLIASFIVALTSVPSLSAAQTSGPTAAEKAAFGAVLLTPVGALPAIVRVRPAFDSAARGDLSLRYGRYTIASNEFLRNDIGLGGMLNLSRRLQAGGTIGYRSCECGSSTMGSVDIGASVWRKEAAGDIGGDTDIGLQMSAGLGKADTLDVTAWSLAVALPVAISLPQPENSLLTLFFSPALVYGIRRLNGVTEGAPLLMFGAGVGYTFQFGLGVHATVHRIVIEDSPTQLGFAISCRFRRS